MTWPWVSRRAYEDRGQAMAQLVAQLETVRQEAMRERAVLIDKITAMQRIGFTVPAASVEPPRPDPLVAEVVAAINLRPHARAYNERWARERLKEGMDSSVVASQIIHGEEGE